MSMYVCVVVIIAVTYILAYVCKGMLARAQRRREEMFYDSLPSTEEMEHWYHEDILYELRLQEEARLRMEDTEEQAYCDDINDRQAH